ncbi:MAG TPA: S-adenosylmethionine decarboxylase [Gaiellaceae bacterium]
MLDHDSVRSVELRANPEVREMRLYAMDAWVHRAAILTDRDRLEAILLGAAERGGACVVGKEFFVFPNGAVTGVLLLAQSHLSLHTWPELALANVDLLSYGDVRGEVVLDVIREELGVERARVRRIRRSLD